MPINTIILVLVIIGLIFLQIKLSKNPNMWLGLIMPIISFMFSLISALRVVAFTSTTLVESSDGVITQVTQTQSLPHILITLVMTLILSNIPTLILLLIYFANRKNIKKNSELDLMKIQDL